MRKSKLQISSAHSAQGSTAKPNPFLATAIRHISENGLVGQDLRKAKVADQGCGKLRHLGILLQNFDKICLVDTSFQLGRTQNLFGERNTIGTHVARLDIRGKQVTTLSDLQFDSSNLLLDIVFNICVFDVEVPKVRMAMLSAAHRNLRNGGLFVLIIPRNDQSILKRCSQNNRYLDGHIFHHHGLSTFYRNFDKTKMKTLIDRLARQGFVLHSDLSRYRQVCLIASRQ